MYTHTIHQNASSHRFPGSSVWTDSMKPFRPVPVSTCKSSAVLLGAGQCISATRRSGTRECCGVRPPADTAEVPERAEDRIQKRCNATTALKIIMGKLARVSDLSAVLRKPSLANLEAPYREYNAPCALYFTSIVQDASGVAPGGWPWTNMEPFLSTLFGE